MAYYGAGTTTTTTVAAITDADRAPRNGSLSLRKARKGMFFVDLTCSEALFLIQATFGPTLSSLQAMGQSSFKQWIDEQMKMPIESHREFYRRRANPYLAPPHGHFWSLSS